MRHRPPLVTFEKHPTLSPWEIDEMANDRDVAFPTLSARDLAALTTRGQFREVKTGETLFREGDRNRAFFVVLDGAVEITEHSHGTPHTVVVHQP